MPEALHKALELRSKKMGLRGKRRVAYIYGTLSKVKKRRKRKGE